MVQERRIFSNAIIELSVAGIKYRYRGGERGELQFSIHVSSLSPGNNLDNKLVKALQPNYLRQFDVRIDILNFSCQRSCRDKLSSKKDCNFVLTGERRGVGKTSLL